MFPFNETSLTWYLKNHVVHETLIKQRKKDGNIFYYNIPCSFDIETTSYTYKGEKCSFMYIWQFAINDFIFYGRSWDDFLKALNIISDLLDTSDKKRLVIYVHNLSFEFQFMRKYLEWSNVFSLDERKPIKALTANGIEFRCSYILSGLSLALTAKNLVSHNIEKLAGDLDYNLVRHENTLLTKQELKYCEYDVKIVIAYIQEQIAEYGDITKIPLTNTSRVRNFVRKNCFYGMKEKKSYSQYQKYHDIMKCLTLAPEEYKLLKFCFQGGFTHANYTKVGQKIENVYSIDFTSSYPAVMLSELYPMSKPLKLGDVPRETMEEKIKLKYKGFMFVVRFTNIVSTKQEMYISEHKCTNTKNISVNNGRVFSADSLITSMNDIDYNICKNCYKWDNVEFFSVYEFTLDYLPKPIILSIIDLYKKKTELKGVLGYENEYLKSKGMLNSVYGMSVTDIVRDEIIYNEEWSTSKADIETKIEEYNESKNRFLYYPWGVWVTAYARKNLWLGILSIGKDYIYSDTDSIKFTNYESHKKFIEMYNANIERKLREMCKHYNIHFSDLKPKTNKGVEKLIGVWDFEGCYQYFKTLGAKRYIYCENDKLHITVAGLSKNYGGDYLTKKYNNDMNKIFSAFNDDLYVPAEFTNKMTHTYIDDDMCIDVVDYQGNEKTVYTKTGIHLEPCDFTLSISKQYQDFLKMFMQGYTFKDNEY
jgi:hypothetical protein